MFELSDPDVGSRHSIRVDASPARAWEALRTLDLGADPVIRWLFRLRGFRTRPLTLDGLSRTGFRVLVEEPPRALVLGLVGRFWSARGGIVVPDDFVAFDEPGYAKATWSFSVEPADGGSVVSTETRVRCTDARARRAFLRYWRVVGPFSGLIRRRTLALIARAVR